LAHRRRRDRRAGAADGFERELVNRDRVLDATKERPAAQPYVAGAVIVLGQARLAGHVQKM
jgi:hypothetical protein